MSMSLTRVLSELLGLSGLLLTLVAWAVLARGFGL